MVKGSIKLVIQSDARQAEKDLQALEKSAQRIKDLEKENAALGKSYDQMRAKAERPRRRHWRLRAKRRQPEIRCIISRKTSDTNTTLALMTLR